MESNFYCPICNCTNLTLQHEATYVYSYILDNNAPGLKNSEEFQSFLYDKREQKDNRTYIECNDCGTQYPYQILTNYLNCKNDT